MGLALRQEFKDLIENTLAKNDKVDIEGLPEISGDYERFSFLYTFVLQAKQKKLKVKGRGESFYSSIDLWLNLVDLDDIQKRCEIIYPRMKLSYLLKVVSEKDRTHLTQSMWVTDQAVLNRAQLLSQNCAKNQDKFNNDFDKLIQDYNTIIKKFFPAMQQPLSRCSSSLSLRSE